MQKTAVTILLIALFAFNGAVFTGSSIKTAQGAQTNTVGFTEYVQPNPDYGFGFGFWRISNKWISQMVGDHTPQNSSISKFFEDYVVPLNIRIVTYDIGWTSNYPSSSLNKVTEHFFEMADKYDLMVLIEMPEWMTSNAWRQRYSTDYLTYPSALEYDNSGKIVTSVSDGSHIPCLWCPKFLQVLENQAQTIINLYGGHTSFIGFYQYTEFSYWYKYYGYGNDTVSAWAHSANFTHYSNDKIEAMFVNGTQQWNTTSLYQDIYQHHWDEWKFWRSQILGGVYKNFQDYLRTNWKSSAIVSIGMHGWASADTFSSIGWQWLYAVNPEFWFESMHIGSSSEIEQRNINHYSNIGTQYGQRYISMLFTSLSYTDVTLEQVKRQLLRDILPYHPRYILVRVDPIDINGQRGLPVGGEKYNFIKSMAQQLRDTPYFNSTVALLNEDAGYLHSPTSSISTQLTGSNNLLRCVIMKDSTLKTGSIIVTNADNVSRWCIITLSPAYDLNITGPYLVVSTSGGFFNIGSSSILALNVTLTGKSMESIVVKPATQDAGYYSTAKILYSGFNETYSSFIVDGVRNASYTLITTRAYPYECSSNVTSLARVDNSAGIAENTYWNNASLGYVVVRFTCLGPTQISVRDSSVRVVDGGVTSLVTLIGQKETVWFKAELEDGKQFNGSMGILFLNGSAMAWSDDNQRWESLYTSNVTGTKMFQVTGYRDNRYAGEYFGYAPNAFEPEQIIWARFKSVYILASSGDIAIQSNSTVSEYLFSSEKTQINMTIQGPTGTVGSLNITVPKSLIADRDPAVEVRIDGQPVKCAVLKDQESYYISLTYAHSSHRLTVSFLQNPFPWLLISVESIGALAVAGFILVKKPHLKTRGKAS